MKKILTGILCSAALTLIGFIVFQKEDPRKLICESVQSGFWAPNGAKCITESCYESKSCGLRAYPAAYCEGIAIGDKISQVYLRLGNPMHVEDDRRQWPWDKTSSSIGVEARFSKDGYLLALDCHASPMEN